MCCMTCREREWECRFCILYGVSGALDRVFAAGSPDEPNVDYWSEWSDPAYFGDVSYSILGQESSPIMGYSVLADTLVTHKQGEENGRNAFVRKGELDSDGFAVFKITNVIQGDGAVATRSFASLNSEPLFLTARGVYALTPSDVTGERYAQERSWYIGAALTYDADGDGVVDRAAAADRVAKKFILQNNAGQQMAEFDGSADRTVQLTPGQVGAEPAFTKNNAFNKNFGSAAGTVCQGNDGRLSNARRASNITMGYDGNLWINYS